MNLKKLVKWSLVLMVFLAYKQLEASVVQDEDTRPAYSVVTLVTTTALNNQNF